MKPFVPRDQHNGARPRIMVQGRDRMDIIKVLQCVLGQRGDFPSDERLQELLDKMRDNSR